MNLILGGFNIFFCLNCFKRNQVIDGRLNFYRKSVPQDKLHLQCLALGVALLFVGVVDAAEISSFESSRGQVLVYEDAGRASFQFEQGGRLNLPADWRETNVERTVPLKNQNTAVVVSYADSKCAASQALIVITPSKIWGPYHLGGCEETLAYQLSSDR